MCVNMYTYCPKYRDAGRAKEYKIGRAVNEACHFGYSYQGFMQRGTLFREEVYRIEPGL